MKKSTETEKEKMEEKRRITMKEKNLAETAAKAALAPAAIAQPCPLVRNSIDGALQRRFLDLHSGPLGNLLRRSVGTPFPASRRFHSGV
ncbi:hypothetical protein ACLOJK_034598 [Asimina triloba]